MKINSQPYSFNQKQVKAIEKKYKAKYVFETELGQGGPIGMVFWQAEPPNGYSNWFAIYKMYNGNVMITAADEYVKDPITAVQVGEDEWIYSHHVHHFCEQGGIAIDGGRGYTRLVGSGLSSAVTASFVATKDGLVRA